jgi:hypothetical protein
MILDEKRVLSLKLPDGQPCENDPKVNSDRSSDMTASAPQCSLIGSLAANVVS